MPKFIIRGGRWGERWRPGQIVEMDEEAAKVRLEQGDLEVYQEKKSEKPAVSKERKKPTVRSTAKTIKRKK